MMGGGWVFAVRWIFMELLHLADDLAGLAERLDHLLALLPAADGIIAFLEQVVDAVGPVHVLQEFSLHFFFRVAIAPDRMLEMPRNMKRSREASV